MRGYPPGTQAADRGATAHRPIHRVCPWSPYATVVPPWSGFHNHRRVQGAVHSPQSFTPRGGARKPPRERARSCSESKPQRCPSRGSAGRRRPTTASRATSLMHQPPESVDMYSGCSVSSRFRILPPEFRVMVIDASHAQCTHTWVAPPPGPPVGRSSFSTTVTALTGQVLARQSYHRAFSVVGRASR